jgi:hypothetical protein
MAADSPRRAPRPALSVPRNLARSRPAPDMNAAAKALMTLGLKIVPLAPAKRGVERSGKWPLTAHGVKDATDSFAAFRRLVGSATDFNIGVATGSASGVVIIDIDPRHGGDREFAKLKQRFGLPPRTLTCDTGGGGQHYYFRAPAGGMKRKSWRRASIYWRRTVTRSRRRRGIRAGNAINGWKIGGPGIRRSRLCPIHGCNSSPAAIRRGMNPFRVTEMQLAKVFGTPS